jgi:pullulanase/glycogen debranching enzyme
VLEHGAVLVNAWWEPLRFRLPDDDRWTVVIDTAGGGGRAAAATIELEGRSLVALRR